MGNVNNFKILKTSMEFAIQHVVKSTFSNREHTVDICRL